MNTSHKQHGTRTRWVCKGSYLGRQVVKGSLLRNGCRLPKRSNGLADLAEAQLTVLVLQDGSVVSRKPHECANGGLRQPGVFLSTRLFSKLALIVVVVAVAAAVGGVGVAAVAAAPGHARRASMLYDALRVQVRKQAVVAGALRGKGAPQSGDLLADIFGSGGGPVDASLDRVSVFCVEEHEWRETPRRGFHCVSCKVARRVLRVEGVSRASLMLSGVATQPRTHFREQKHTRK